MVLLGLRVVVRFRVVLLLRISLLRVLRVMMVLRVWVPGVLFLRSPSRVVSLMRSVRRSLLFVFVGIFLILRLCG